MIMASAIKVAAKLTAGGTDPLAISIEMAIPRALPNRPNPILTAIARASSYPLNHLTMVRVQMTQTTSSPDPNMIRPTIINVSMVLWLSPKKPADARAEIPAPTAASDPKTNPATRTFHLSRIIPPTMIIPNIFAIVVRPMSLPNSSLVNPMELSIRGFSPPKKSWNQ